MWVRTATPLALPERRAAGWCPALLCLVPSVLWLAGCLASSKPVRMSNGERALRIECSYTLDNCKRQALSACHGDYEVITHGDLSCGDCGALDTAQSGAENNNVYKGVLYVRCR